jgi:hypothetical protein
MNLTELQPRFAALFSGLDQAFGTGAGRWVKRSPRRDDWLFHLQGQGDGMGIAPLREDSTVNFAAIDLDEPDFDAAREMQEFIPGRSFLEHSRSGNAHVWVFFEQPVEAWLPMAILKEATKAVGKDHVEVFPKNHDFARVRLGNYINLPYHGDARQVEDGAGGFYSLERFLDLAEGTKNDPNKWRKQADWMMLTSPEEREQTSEFGTQESLHICAEHVLSGAAGPVREGHRSVVYFSLAKMLTNCKHYDHDEVVELLRSVNENSAPDDIPDHELLRILGNAERGQYTSTGCDDPLFGSYAHPDCKIANPRS